MRPAKPIALERRRHFRVDGAWPVELRMGHGVAAQGRAVDISLGGMLVEVDAPVAPSTGATVEVGLPAEIGWVAARVVRLLEVADDDHPRWGLELGDLPTDVRAAWARHVFTEARRRGYHEDVDAWIAQTRSSSLICPTCGNLMDATTAPERLVTAADLATHLEVRVGMVYRMARSGRLPSYRIGRRLRFDLVEVRDALKAANGR